MSKSGVSAVQSLGLVVRSLNPSNDANIYIPVNQLGDHSESQAGKTAPAFPNNLRDSSINTSNVLSAGLQVRGPFRCYLSHSQHDWTRCSQPNIGASCSKQKVV